MTSHTQPTLPTNVAQERGDTCGCHENYEARFPGITQTEDPHLTGCANGYPKPSARRRRPRPITSRL